jgi:hypothetical protein
MSGERLALDAARPPGLHSAMSLGSGGSYLID